MKRERVEMEQFRKSLPTRYLIDTLRGFEALVPKLMQCDEAGKLSPEGGRFVARIMRRLAEQLNAAAFDLEENQ